MPVNVRWRRGVPGRGLALRPTTRVNGPLASNRKKLAHSSTAPGPGVAGVVGDLLATHWAPTMSSTRRPRLDVRELDSRIVPTVTATFVGGLLTITGDDVSNEISIGADASGAITLSGVANPPSGINLATCQAMIVLGQGSNDTINLSDLPVGNRTIFVDGGAGDDNIIGTAGPDALAGGDGRDFIFGGAGDDILTGDRGDDQLAGDAGNDSIDGGTGSDAVTGGAGDD